MQEAIAPIRDILSNSLDQDMDAFVTRKKRKLGSDSPESKEQMLKSGPVPAGDGDEPTDVKLAILSSAHPALDQETLFEILIAHDGIVSEALQSLKTQVPLKRSNGIIGAQSSLRSFASAPAGEESPSSGKRAKLLSKKGKTLFLYDPVDVAEHTPCTVIHNFLPSDVANDLLREMLEESKTYEKITFKLFENVVSSPHTSSFYVGSLEEVNRQKLEYQYNGAALTDVRQLTPHLEKIKPLVATAVNKEINQRITTCYPGGRKLKHQSPDPWRPNAAFVNCYNGPQESVGWHADHLTYLGPRAVIGSLSLGVAREFRVRKVVPQDGDATSTDHGDAQGQISIRLPHNSLLVMHAEMQEEWKHSIAPATAIDPHPVAGNRRINITYRDYKEEFHPRFTPRCKCGVPTVLRVVQRKRENWGRYFWMCHAGNVPGKEGCSYFEWAVFDEDGRPVWEKGKGKGGDMVKEKG